MEENDLKDDVVVEEETTEEVDSSDGPTLEDYERIAKENKTLQAQKEHWRKKAEVIKSQPLTKTNETQSSLSREEAILYAKGYTDEEVQYANKIARIEGVSPLVAIEDELFKTKVEQRKQKELSEKAALPASGGSSRYQAEKPIGEMTEEEHRAYFDKVMGN